MKGYAYYNPNTNEYGLCAILNEADGLMEVVDLHTGEVFTLSTEWLR